MTTETETVTPPPPPGFLQFIASHEGGTTAETLTKQLHSIVAHLEQLNQDEGVKKSKGALTIKVLFERDDGVYRVGIETTVKLPEAPTRRSVYWATAANGLVQQDPRQARLPFQDVPRRAAIIVDAGAGHGNV